MADFHQSGVITTLHRLGSMDGDRLEQLEQRVNRYAHTRPIALVLPCLHSEVRGPALAGIVEELRQVPYLKQVVVSVAGTSKRDEFDEVRKAFDGVHTMDGGSPTFLWEQGEGVQALYANLASEGLNPGDAGKGRGVWLAYGYILAAGQSSVIALHDCDIVGGTSANS